MHSVILKDKDDHSEKLDKASFLSNFKMIQGSDSNSLINKTPNGQNCNLEKDSTPGGWREVVK